MKLNKKLMQDILPRMNSLGDNVTSQAKEAAQNASTVLRERKESVKSTLIVIALISIIFGIVVGVLIVNSINASISSLQKYMKLMLR